MDFAEIEHPTNESSSNAMEMQLDNAHHFDSQIEKQDDSQLYRDSSHQRPPSKSVEGWVILVTNIHEEASDVDVEDRLSDYGQVTNMQMPLDRRTGYVKGYALVEYKERSHAEEAITTLNGTMFMNQIISVDWAISSEPI